MNKLSVNPDTTWMLRCFDLARRGIGYVSPNPPVGAVLVHEDRILAEGYHTHFGGPHAEVVAISNVLPPDRHLIRHSILYVSLEPCCIIGKTPPCTDLILQEGIKDVRISTRDPNPFIAGKGIGILLANRIAVTEGILESTGKSMIRTFAMNILYKRPYVILKWAQSSHGMIGKKGEQIWISHPSSKAFTHRQRAECDVILVGARTIETDDPLLTTREYPGKSPHKAIYDPSGRLNRDYKIFDNNGSHVFYFSEVPNQSLQGEHIKKFQLDSTKSHIHQMLQVLIDHQAGILLVEGGAYLQNLFIKEGLWDEAWVIRSGHPLDQGIQAPNVKGRLIDKIKSGSDVIIGIENDPQTG